MKLNKEEKVLFEPRIRFLIYMFCSPISKGTFIGDFLRKVFEIEAEGLERGEEVGVDIKRCFYIHYQKTYK